MQHRAATFEVVVHGNVRYTVLVHYLDPTELVIRCVNFSSEKFVQSSCAGQDYVRRFQLNGSLSKSDEVCTDTDSSASNQRNGDNIVIGPRGFSGYHSGEAQIFDSYTVVFAENIREQVPRFVFVFNQLCVLHRIQSGYLEPEVATIIIY